MSANNYLIELRKRHGYTKQEVADKLSITRQTYKKFESDESQPTTKQLSILADFVEYQSKSSFMVFKT